MLSKKQISSCLLLKNYCERHNFSGWDPYDGLNSKLFQNLPLKNWDLARLAWIQGFKRLPINLRSLVLVSKGHNAKGIGLFLSAYCNLYKRQNYHYDNLFGTSIELMNRIIDLASILESLKSTGYSGACWGYNFDWQARGGLFFPAGTPNVVATTFATFGLLDAYDVTGNQKYLDTAISSAHFVTQDLNRSIRTDGSFLFSYAPLPGNNNVYNASLLGSKLLARVYSYTCAPDILDPAAKSVQACLSAQEVDGSWNYGELTIQNWKDSYHTGFNLVSMYEYRKFTGDDSVNVAINKGLHFYLNNFFLDDGTPKYYHNNTYPIDIHSPAQLLVTLSRLNIYDKNRDFALKVLDWTIANMQHPSQGYFYYQLKKVLSSKIPYMRWNQAWMLYAFTLILEQESK